MNVYAIGENVLTEDEDVLTESENVLTGSENVLRRAPDDLAGTVPVFARRVTWRVRGVVVCARG